MLHKNAPRGSHCGGNETVAFAARPRRRIPRSRILFYRKYVWISVKKLCGTGMPAEKQEFRNL
ncbi:hypothetical protein CLOM621_08258 [Clostridium sp. M62/1]|nr:hypothetical protein CLOM621_08258 [Clostridium sp. M62/1]